MTASTKLARDDWGLDWNVALEQGGWLVGKEIKLDIAVAADEVAVAETRRAGRRRLLTPAPSARGGAAGHDALRYTTPLRASVDARVVQRDPAGVMLSGLQSRRDRHRRRHRRDAPSAAHLAGDRSVGAPGGAGELGAGASGRNSGVVQHPFDPVMVELYRETLALYRGPDDDGPTGRSACPSGRPGMLMASLDAGRRAER